MASSCRARTSLVIISGLSALLVASGNPLRCWQGACTATDSISECQGRLLQSPRSLDYDDKKFACVQYGFICEGDDHACTAKEAKTSAKKTSYTIVGVGTAKQMKSAGFVYRDLLSCSTDFCNAPGKDAQEHHGRHPEAKFDGGVPASATSFSASLREVSARTVVGSAVLVGLAAVAYSAARLRRRPALGALLGHEEMPALEVESGLD